MPNAYSFDRESSKTSTDCSTRLLAVRSSLPTVTRTGFIWNVDASLRTASGHVALTARVDVSDNCTRKPRVMLTHEGLAFGTLLGVADDGANIILEALVQHPVCFIKDKVRHANSQSQ